MTRQLQILAGACGLALLASVTLFAPRAAEAQQPEATIGVPGPSLPDTAQAPDGTTPPSWSGQAFRQGVVTTSESLPAEAGAQILEAGGNAIDAAAAVQFALNVVEPQSSGIGGGGFMMIHLAESNETFFVSSREMAPAAAFPELFADQTTFSLPSTSGFSVGVPGTLLGIETALARWGTMSLAETLQPAIGLAEDGIAVSTRLEGSILSSRLQSESDPPGAYQVARDVFIPNGVPLKAGDILVQPDLAKTFKLIAAQGSDVFYKRDGEIARAIVEAQKATRKELPGGVGLMTLDDLENYTVEVLEPVTGEYRGFTVKGMPPPSSGGLTVIQMLLMLEQFDLGDQGAGFGFGATNTLHVLLEAMRLAYADRAVWDGDETCALCSDVPTVGLLNPLYVGPRAGQIQVDSRLENALPGDPRPFDVASVPGKVRFAAFAPEMQKGVNTTHFTVIDGHGNIVSYTSTIESGWGTGIMVPGFGFLLNNELTDFNFRPRANDDPNAFDPGANDVAANKRPRSSMAPTMVFKDGKPVAAYGSPGGSSIINTALNITLNLIDHGMSVQEAIDAPRISRTSSSDSGTVSCEGGFSAEALAGVTALGHVLRGSCLDGSGVIGSVQAVIVDLQTGKQYGGADARRIGTVIGLPRPAAD